jgi:hypothetical protein
MRNKRAYPMLPAGPVTATTRGFFMAILLGRSYSDALDAASPVAAGRALV